jgi:cupin 2 domain-containing protein
MRPGRLFADLPAPPRDEEQFDTLVQAPGVVIERIVSTGQRTPEGAWLVQDRDEWVVLLRGSATLRLEGEPEDTPMAPGDFIHLPANTRHRVERTDADGPTVWLAVHYDAGPPARDHARTDPTP